jgi:hypothetical protein
MKTRPAESGYTAANSSGVPEEKTCMTAVASASGVRDGSPAPGAPLA